MDPRAPCSDKNHLRQGWLEEPNKICYITVFLRIWKYLFHVLIYKIIAYQVYFSIIELGNWRVTEEQRLEGGLGWEGRIRWAQLGRFGQPPRDNLQDGDNLQGKTPRRNIWFSLLLARKRNHSLDVRFSVKQLPLSSGNLLDCGMWASPTDSCHISSIIFLLQIAVKCLVSLFLSASRDVPDAQRRNTFFFLFIFCKLCTFCPPLYCQESPPPAIRTWRRLQKRRLDLRLSRKYGSLDAFC